MAFIDMSGFTTADLEAKVVALDAAWLRTLGSEAYTVQARSIKRTNLDTIMNQLSGIKAELHARSDTTGGVGLVEFDEQE